MKKIFLLFTVAMAGYTIAFSQTLFTYGNNAVSKEEFLKAYNKNPGFDTNKTKSLKEYLDLYINFKLKVEAAKAAKLDTLLQLQYDVQAFKNQVLDNYLNNEADVNALVNEAFARSQKDLHVQHFFISNDSGFVPDKATKALCDALQKENTNYQQLAKNVTDKYGYEIKTADLGYITAFSIPYEFENIIYALEPGQVSKPYNVQRSSFNTHIFKVHDERKAIGKWKIAQILLAIPPGEQAVNFKPLQAKADSIYQLLKNGADFGKLAKQYSDDKLTYLNNGEMPEFGCGKYDISFEKEVIKLKNNGDINTPFLTTHGFHIIKRINQIPVTANNGETEYLYELKQKVLQDSRINAAKEKFIQNIIKQTGFKRNAAVPDAALFANADSIAINKNYEKIKNSPISDKTIFSFGKTTIKGSNWLNFIKDYKNNPQLYKGENYNQLLQKYINIEATEYYKQHLEEYNPQYAYQVKEFKEGNMLFEIMERNVWNKATNDSAGIKKYYNSNKNKYLWAPSADVIIFNCPDIKTANEAKDIVTSSKDWKKNFEQNNINIQTDSGRYELLQLSLENVKNITAGSITNPVANTTDGTASFIKILKLYPANQPRNFEEARGLLMGDFQNETEKQWIADLKKKYPVKVNEPVFQSLLKE